MRTMKLLPAVAAAACAVATISGCGSGSSSPPSTRAATASAAFAATTKAMGDHCVMGDAADDVEIYIGAPAASIQASGGCDILEKSFAKYGATWVLGALSPMPHITCELTYKSDRGIVAGVSPLATRICAGMEHAGWTTA
jgi:hypothetical protein